MEPIAIFHLGFYRPREAMHRELEKDAEQCRIENITLLIVELVDLKDEQPHRHCQRLE